MSLFLIAYKSPQSDEKEKCNKYFVLYRRIFFTGKTLAPSSSCSLPVLYILMQLPAALYLALSLTVGHRHVFFSQNRSELIHTAGLRIADSSRYLACQIFCGRRRRVGDSLRSRLWSFTLRDCHSRERAPICLRSRAFVGDLSKPVGEWKIGLKSCSVNLA